MPPLRDFNKQPHSIPSRGMAEGQGRTAECQSHSRFMQNPPWQLWAQSPASSWVTRARGTCPESATCLSGWSLSHASPGRPPEALEQGEPSTVTRARSKAGTEGCHPGQIAPHPSSHQVSGQSKVSRGSMRARSRGVAPHLGAVHCASFGKRGVRSEDWHRGYLSLTQTQI